MNFLRKSALLSFVISFYFSMILAFFFFVARPDQIIEEGWFSVALTLWLGLGSLCGFVVGIVALIAEYVNDEAVSVGFRISRIILILVDLSLMTLVTFPLLVLVKLLL